MMKISSLFVLLCVVLTSCSLEPGKTKQIRNVSAPSRLPDLSKATSSIFIATDSLPENLRVMTVTISDDDSINAAMDRLLVRLRGTAKNKPELLPGNKAVAKGGMLESSGKSRKMNYTTKLEGTGEYISIGLTSLQFVTMGEESQGPGRILLSVNTPEGKKKVKTTADKITGASEPVTQYHGMLTLRLAAMMEDGTYAEEKLNAFATIWLPDNFPAGFHTLNYPHGFQNR